jgi:hypothetical protein
MTRLLLLVLLVACNVPGGELPPPPASVKVVEGSAVIKEGAIGIQDRQDATYVLVQAENGSKEPRQVALKGELVNLSGVTIAKLFPDELLIPPGERRTFALVAGGVFHDAHTAAIRVAAAIESKHEPFTKVTEVKTERGPKGLIAVVTVANTHKGLAVATVIATFYDKDGKIISRPFAPVQMAGKSSRTFTIAGPLEAVKADAYVGDSAL